MVCCRSGVSGKWPQVFSSTGHKQGFFTLDDWIDERNHGIEGGLGLVPGFMPPVAFEAYIIFKAERVESRRQELPSRFCSQCSKVNSPPAPVKGEPGGAGGRFLGSSKGKGQPGAGKMEEKGLGIGQRAGR